MTNHINGLQSDKKRQVKRFITYETDFFIPETTLASCKGLSQRAKIAIR